jgi:hypothetical protein
MTRKLREVEVFTLIFSIPAFLSVVARIALRRRRLWFDDASALFSALALLVQLCAVFIVTYHEGPGIARYYLIATGFYTVVWSARLSMLFSIIRIDPNLRRRRWLYFIASLYIVVYILLGFQLLWVCQQEGPWKKLATPQCHLTVSVAVAQLTTDIFADGSLVIIPMIVFRALDDRRLRRRLMVIFSTCVITTIVSLVHAIYLLTTSGLPVLVAGITEDCISLVVCSIPVIATAVLQQGQEALARRRKSVNILFTAALQPGNQETDLYDATTPNDLGNLPVHVHVKVENDRFSSITEP